MEVSRRGKPGSDRFVGIVNKLPWGSEELIGMGLQWFLERSEPEEVNFVAYSNGYAIEVKADEESVQEAKEFWENEVQPNLEGEV